MVDTSVRLDAVEKLVKQLRDEVGSGRLAAIERTLSTDSSRLDSHERATAKSISYLSEKMSHVDKIVMTHAMELRHLVRSSNAGFERIARSLETIIGLMGGDRSEKTLIFGRPDSE